MRYDLTDILLAVGVVLIAIAYGILIGVLVS